jgi:hypothetical protein
MPTLRPGMTIFTSLIKVRSVRVFMTIQTGGMLSRHKLPVSMASLTFNIFVLSGKYVVDIFFGRMIKKRLKNGQCAPIHSLVTAITLLKQTALAHFSPMRVLVTVARITSLFQTQPGILVDVTVCTFDIRVLPFQRKARRRMAKFVLLKLYQFKLKPFVV